MAQGSDQNSSSGCALPGLPQSDRYLFWALDSSAANREKLNEGELGLRPAGRGRNGVAGCGDQLGTKKLGMANDVWSGVLRDRDDVDGWIKIRHRAVWRGGIPAVSPAERSDDSGGAGIAEDGSGDSPVVRANA